MKPKEFDDLVKRKFDQADFEYNPKNWDALNEQLDGKAKKRSLILWWWIPLAGMAASVAMAMGVTSLMRPQGAGMQPVAVYAQNHKYTDTNAPIAASPDNITSAPATHKQATAKYAHHEAAPLKKENTGNWFAIRMENAVVSANAAPAKTVDLLNAAVPEIKKKAMAIVQPPATFKPEAEVKKAPKLSVILSGGINHGNQNSGYLAGATIRRMISDKVYVESDLGFASSNNTQTMESVITSSHQVAATRVTGNAASKTTSAESTTSPTKTVLSYSTEDHDVSYNLYYAQVSPSIGYKLMKRMSIGVGPDFQQMLVDNRPTPSATDPGNIQQAPVFDIGFIGKTEYALTKKVKAAVYYRKGINDIIATSDKYIDRNYLQFQLKCVIFNK